jgi:hypothetical protein
MRLGLLPGIAVWSLGLAAVFVGCGSEDDKKKDRSDYDAGGEGGASGDSAISGGPGATSSDAGTTSMAGEPSEGGTAGVGGSTPVTGGSGAGGTGEGGAGGETTLPFHGLYIGEGGDDMADGTHDSPFATLAHAAIVAQAGDTIVFLDGAFTVPGPVTIPAGVALQAENAGAATLSGSQIALSLSGDTLISGLKFQGFTKVVTFPAAGLASGTVTIDATSFGNCQTMCLELTGATRAVVSSGIGEVLGNGGISFATLAGTSSLSISGGVLQKYEAAGIVRATDDSSVTLQDVEVQDGTGRVLALAKNAVGHVEGATIATLSANLFQQGDESDLVVTDSDLSLKSDATFNNCFTLLSNGGTLRIERSKLHGCGTGIKGVPPTDLEVLDTEFYDLSFGGADLEPGGGSQTSKIIVTGCDVHDVTYTGLRIGGSGTLLDLKIRDTSIDVTTLPNWHGLTISGTNASSIDLGTLAEPGGNTFLQHAASLATAVQLNLQAQTVLAVGNTWTPNAQGADAQGHYLVESGKVREDSTATTSGINYIKPHATTTIRLAQIP